MVKAKWALLGVAGALVLAGAAGAAAYAFDLGPFAGGPQQPVAFPHDVHAGENQIPCMYCHTGADRSADAGIPSMQVCAGCHVPGGSAAAGAGADHPEVKKLVAYWEEQRPIPWVQIHDLPDHAHFPHMRHVKAGLQCQQCHGAVEEMEEVEQFASLRMGWCIDCHREREVRTDCAVCHY